MFKDVQQQQQQQHYYQTTLTPTKLLMETNNWNLNPFENTTTTLEQKVFINSSSPTKQRKKLLEKNREAAYRCRQKKKKWINSLEEQSYIAETKNRELQEIVAHLREESIYLRNLLLTHGNCDCEVVQAYLRRTSEQLSSRLPNTNSSFSDSSESSSSLSSQQRQTSFFI
ncbi:uncharacterized protein BX663DRAFT_508263 [Cokeromyces recurvatus]|uniref:uncharacterized protein n=1 Tax=Cokeromyces recurvatus TaxID=90255 RepID=UPI0022210D5A|nr:uncharacterized protein BX663DRAFT_508263 [Cokeromyces recurvatus]KAI7903337.1 hypothetical protein BX663DRAFT_508263 [Cokeromyces recurvatus]